MKKINYKFFLLFLFSILIISCGDDDKNPTDPGSGGGDLIVDPALVGTWDLTKITSTTFGVFTPAQLGLSFTTTFNGDGSFESTLVDVDGTAIDTGVWGVSEGVITIILEGEEPETQPYVINGNIVNLDSSVPYQGIDIPANLEFTKRP